MSRGTAGGRAVASLLAVALLAAAAGCNKTWTTADEGDPRPLKPEESVAVGAGVDFTDPAPDLATATVDGAAPSSATSAPPVGAAATPAADFHPRDEHGNRILNRTVREAEGLRLTFTIDGQLTYPEGEGIYFSFQIENLGDAPVFYDPDARDVIVVAAGDDTRWTNGSCLPDFGDDSFDTGAVVVEPGDYVTLDYTYEADGPFADDASCRITRGEWRVDARFPRCPEDQVERDRYGNPSCEGTRVRAVAAHPLTITVT